MLDDLAQVLAGVAGAAGHFGLGPSGPGGDELPDHCVQRLQRLAVGGLGLRDSGKREIEIVHTQKTTAVGQVPLLYASYGWQTRRNGRARC